jgi:hypothetical protein
VHDESRLIANSGWIAVLALPLCFYLCLPTYNFYWDGVAFAISIEKAPPVAGLLHPNHLGYTFWSYCLYKMSRMLGIGSRALFVMRTANGVLSALCVLLLYVCFRLRKSTVEMSALTALMFGFSATWWRFASDANAYVPSIFLLLCAYLIVEHSKATALAGLAHAAAMVFHELAILFLPVALIQLRRSGRKSACAAYTASALIPVTAAYAWAYDAMSGKPALSGFISWITSHSSDSKFVFNPVQNAALSVRGTFRLFFGGKPSDFAGDYLSMGAAIVLVAAVVSFVIAIWRAARTRMSFSRPSLHLVVWVCVYIVFLFVWMPQNTFYRLFYLPALVAIICTALPDLPSTRNALRLFVSILFLWNFVFVAYPQSRPEYNAPLRFALANRKTWPAGTPIAFHRFHPDLWTISYFNPQASWIGIDEFNLDTLEHYLEQARSGDHPLWLEQSVYDLIAENPKGQLWLNMHEQRGELLAFTDGKHAFRFHAVR